MASWGSCVILSRKFTKTIEISVKKMVHLKNYLFENGAEYPSKSKGCVFTKKFMHMSCPKRALSFKIWSLTRRDFTS